jgi:hypothetical protein
MNVQDLLQSMMARFLPRFAVLALLSTIVTVVAAPVGQASANGTPTVEDTYPDSDAKKCPGVYSWCKDGGGYADHGSPRGYAYRNCTDWAAWRIPEITGVKVPWGLGNAKEWAVKGPRFGFEVDQAPEVGDAAVWTHGDYGHVEVVEVVNADGSVDTSGYNKKGTGEFAVRTGVRADVYVDFNGPNEDAPSPREHGRMVGSKVDERRWRSDWDVVETLTVDGIAYLLLFDETATDKPGKGEIRIHELEDGTVGKLTYKRYWSSDWAKFVPMDTDLDGDADQLFMLHDSGLVRIHDLVS